MKKIIALLTLLIAWSALSAAPISEQQARRIAANFFSRGVTRATESLELAWAGHSFENASRNGEEPLLYIYNRNDRDGFVIVAGEEGASPIIGYSEERPFEVERIAPGARYLLESWMKQLAALRSGRQVQVEAITSPGEVVRKFPTALWDQWTPYNNEAPIYDGYRSVTGCVATALAIICHYHRYPTKGVGTTGAYSYYDPTGIERSIAPHTLGRSYNYDKMLSDYSQGYTKEEGAAVAALMHDIGKAVKMQYHYNESGAYGNDARYGMLTHFGYSRNAVLMPGDAFTYKEWIKLVRENIEQYGPTYFSGSLAEGGHAFVLDGYTQNNYFSINYGWSGAGNGYYLLPLIEYSEGQWAMCRYEPDPNGTSTDPGQLVLYPYGDMLGLRSMAVEHRTGVPFTIQPGAVANVGDTQFTGTVGLALCRADGSIKEYLFTTRLSLEPYYLVVYQSEQVTINSQIEEGDRLRMVYLKDSENEPVWARKYGSTVVDDLILVATPEEAASQVSLQYDKTGKTIYLTAPYAIGYSLTQISTSKEIGSGRVASYNEGAIDTSSCTKGNYRLSISSGGRAYELTIKL